MTSCCIGAARFAACATAIPTFSFLAPLSLLPVPIDLLVSLLFGALDVTTWVNVSAVCRALRLRGYSAEPLSPPKSEGGFLRASVVMGTTLRQLTLAPHLREAMALELMTTPTLLGLVDTAFRSTWIEPTETSIRSWSLRMRRASGKCRLDPLHLRDHVGLSRSPTGLLIATCLSGLRRVHLVSYRDNARDNIQIVQSGHRVLSRAQNQPSRADRADRGSRPVAWCRSGSDGTWWFRPTRRR